MKRILTLFLFLISTGFVIGQTSPVQITDIPSPELLAEYGLIDVQGTISLRVEFLASGKIGRITTLKGLPHGLTELASAAAERIRFLPAFVEGTPISTFRPVAYTYSWRFGGWKRKRATEIREQTDEQAEVVVKRAVERLGGERYLKVTSQVGRGRFSSFRDGSVIMSQTFIDVIVYPDKERTEFKGGAKSKFVQTNTGSTGWVYDGDQELIKIQNEAQVENFHRGMRVSIDTLLRGGWRGKGEISYAGRRPSTLGKRNDVVRLKYEDGLTIDYEFAADGTPMKASYKRTNSEGEEVTEEDRYAQWVDISGIRVPYIVDRFTNGKAAARINYESIEFNVRVPDSIFEKPTNPKELKKALKL